MNHGLVLETDGKLERIRKSYHSSREVIVRDSSNLHAPDDAGGGGGSFRVRSPARSPAGSPPPSPSDQAARSTRRGQQLSPHSQSMSHHSQAATSRTSSAHQLTRSHTEAPKPKWRGGKMKKCWVCQNIVCSCDRPAGGAPTPPAALDRSNVSHHGHGGGTATSRHDSSVSTHHQSHVRQPRQKPEQQHLAAPAPTAFRRARSHSDADPHGSSASTAAPSAPASSGARRSIIERLHLGLTARPKQQHVDPAPSVSRPPNTARSSRSATSAATASERSHPHMVVGTRKVVRHRLSYDADGHPYSSEVDDEEVVSSASTAPSAAARRAGRATRGGAQQQVRDQRAAAPVPALSVSQESERSQRLERTPQPVQQHHQYQQQQHHREPSPPRSMLESIARDIDANTDQWSPRQHEQFGGERPQQSPTRLQPPPDTSALHTSGGSAGGHEGSIVLPVPDHSPIPHVDSALERSVPPRVADTSSSALVAPTRAIPSTRFVSRPEHGEFDDRVVRGHDASRRARSAGDRLSRRTKEDERERDRDRHRYRDRTQRRRHHRRSSDSYDDDLSRSVSDDRTASWDSSDSEQSSSSSAHRHRRRHRGNRDDDSVSSYSSDRRGKKSKKSSRHRHERRGGDDKHRRRSGSSRAAATRSHSASVSSKKRHAGKSSSRRHASDEERSRRRPERDDDRNRRRRRSNSATSESEEVSTQPHGQQKKSQSSLPPPPQSQPPNAGDDALRRQVDELLAKQNELQEHVATTESHLAALLAQKAATDAIRIANSAAASASGEGRTPSRSTSFAPSPTAPHVRPLEASSSGAALATAAGSGRTETRTSASTPEPLEIPVHPAFRDAGAPRPELARRYNGGVPMGGGVGHLPPPQPRADPIARGGYGGYLMRGLIHVVTLPVACCLRPRDPDEMSDDGHDVSAGSAGSAAGANTTPPPAASGSIDPELLARAFEAAKSREQLPRDGTVSVVVAPPGVDAPPPRAHSLPPEQQAAWTSAASVTVATSPMQLDAEGDGDADSQPAAAATADASGASTTDASSSSFVIDASEPTQATTTAEARNDAVPEAGRDDGGDARASTPRGDASKSPDEALSPLSPDQPNAVNDDGTATVDAPREEEGRPLGTPSRDEYGAQVADADAPSCGSGTPIATSLPEDDLVVQVADPAPPEPVTEPPANGARPAVVGNSAATSDSEVNDPTSTPSPAPKARGDGRVMEWPY